MKSPFPHAYTKNHALLGDGVVGFDCSMDAEIWPWLKLEPIAPILVQTITFWGSVESGMFLGTFDPRKRSALAQTNWECGPPGVGVPVRGRYETSQAGDHRRFALEYFDADERRVARMSGQGVVFRTRDFESWRNDAKEKIVKPEPPAFAYAPPAALGVATPGECFLAPIAPGQTVRVAGLITKARGLIPGHPYIGGSGDHVNSTHMGEIGRQFGDLLLGRQWINTGGEMVFSHYVELGSPFEVSLIEHAPEAKTYELLVQQAGHDCTEIRMSYALVS